jgi:hypothetical protein
MFHNPLNCFVELIGKGDFLLILIIRFSKKDISDFSGRGRTDFMLFSKLNLRFRM